MLVAIRKKMIRLIQILILSLLVFQLHAQNEIELMSDSLINQMSDDFKVSENDARINRYANSGTSWSKRYDLKSKKHFLNKYGQKDYLDYSFTFFYFSDADSCFNARNEYLQHYSWKSGALTDSTKYTARPPSFNLINDNSIIIFEVSCEEYEMGEKWSWEKVKSILLSTFKSNATEIIENGCGGPVKWINKKE
jgi:hypothetical protein